MRDFRRLKVWELAHAAVLDIYSVTEGMPQHELFGLTSQLRRASSSISTNIAEGCGKDSEKEFARFLKISFSSACETEYRLILCSDLNYLCHNEVENIRKQVESIKKMLATLIRKIRPIPS